MAAKNVLWFHFQNIAIMNIKKHAALSFHKSILFRQYHNLLPPVWNFDLILSFDIKNVDNQCCTLLVNTSKTLSLFLLDFVASTQQVILLSYLGNENR